MRCKCKRNRNGFNGWKNHFNHLNEEGEAKMLLFKCP